MMIASELLRRVIAKWLGHSMQGQIRQVDDVLGVNAKIGLFELIIL